MGGEGRVSPLRSPCPRPPPVELPGNPTQRVNSVVNEELTKSPSDCSVPRALQGDRPSNPPEHPSCPTDVPEMMQCGPWAPNVPSRTEARRLCLATACAAHLGSTPTCYSSQPTTSLGTLSQHLTGLLGQGGHSFRTTVVQVPRG